MRGSLCYYGMTQKVSFGSLLLRLIMGQVGICWGKSY